MQFTKDREYYAHLVDQQILSVEQMFITDLKEERKGNPHEWTDRWAHSLVAALTMFQDVFVAGENISIEIKRANYYSSRLLTMIENTDTEYLEDPKWIIYMTEFRKNLDGNSDPLDDDLILYGSEFLSKYANSIEALRVKF